MSVSSSLSGFASSRQSMATQSVGLSSMREARLQRSGHRSPFATSISSSGWVATSSSREVLLYNVQSVDQNRDFAPAVVLPVELLKKEEIRAIALSNDLLAVVTQRRLLVYDEYNRGLPMIPFNIQPIDREGRWTPRSVSISQRTASATRYTPTACIAVGGEQEIGVKVFRYVYTTAWNILDDRATLLSCPQNIGAVKSLSFSPDRDKALYGMMICALTTGNRLYCWAMDGRFDNSTRSLLPNWYIDCNPTRNRNVSVAQDGVVVRGLIDPGLSRRDIFHQPVRLTNRQAVYSRHSEP